ncbi:PadR family transcriptional regulator [Actinomadura sp. DC4]|uniref:PadR family transcriptional regulator n=1 Tax=Actinomadura sp. DC4 TaxID=3055069 RepID=UPI0025B0C946|nr:PadR family transcriptional regulator [Actinomadura sp. DC4]MDN3359121.1 PadR family transcriptional regulator [Actinomadura sp. DC4]
MTSPLALSVLATLSEGPTHPYEIARLLKRRGKDQSVKIRYGSLYTVVQSLEDQGFVTAEGTAKPGRRPERTVYRLTGDGRDELHDRLRELISEPAKEYPLFEAALSLIGVLPPDDVIALLTERLRMLEVELAGTRATLHELIVEQRLPRLFLVESEYSLAMKQAETDWVRGMIAELTDGSLEGVDHWRTWHKTGEFPGEWAQRDWAKADRAGRESEVDEPG